MNTTNLEDEIVRFVKQWAPKDTIRRGMFIEQLRYILEFYGRSALLHGDLPDTEHPHKERSKHG